MEGYKSLQKLYPLEFYRKFLVHGLRPDARPLDKARKLKVTRGTVSTANGSSFVKLGQTSIVAGIKAELGPECDNHKLSDQLIINVELTPICGNKFKPGKPSEQAQTLGQFLNDIVLHRNIVSIAEPSIMVEERIKFVWYLYIDIYCLNYDGNILDASLIAMLAALKDVKLPTVTLEDNKLISNGVLSNGGVQLLEYPIPLTFGLMDDYILIDPTSEEEDLLASKFTIIYSNLKKLSHISKPGGVPISEDKLRICIQKTRERMDEVLHILNSE